MVFCFDLDDVIADTYPVLLEASLSYHQEVLGREVPVGPREARLARGDYFYFAKSLLWNGADVTAFYYEAYPFFLERVVPRPSSCSVLKKIHCAGHSICILSARELRIYADVEQMTQRWLSEHHIPCDALIVGAKEKQADLERLGCVSFVDDSYAHCLAAVKAHVSRVYFYRCEYNQELLLPGGAEIHSICSLEELVCHT